MHHPFAALLWLIVIAVCLTVLLSKKPHKSWLKVTFAGCIVTTFLYSVYGMSQRNAGMAIFFVVAMIAILVWRTIKGWPEWWAKL